MTVFIARCPEHGLHGEREECFVCGGPVEQVEMVEVRSLPADNTDALLAEARALADEWQSRPSKTRVFAAHLLLRRLCIKIENLRAAAYLNGIERDELRDRLGMP